MRLMQWHRQPWRVDLAFLLTLCLLFLPAWVGLQPGNEARVAAQPPAPVAARPILVVPFQAAEGVPTGVTEGVTFALVEELEASRQLSPTRLSLDEPTIQRLIQEGQLTEDAVTDVLQQPTPEGIAQIASAMKVADAVYGTVDSYTYDPQANGGVVRVKVTARFLKVDPTTGAVTETKEISKEGSSAPKLAPRPEKELASEAFRNAVRQIVSEFLGLPAPPPPPPPPKAISPLPVLIGLLLLGALIGAGRGRAAPPAPPIAPGPANAPSRVAAIPQGQAILVTWQIPVQGTPLGYNVYRADAGLAPSARQADNFQRLNTAPVPTTQYLDTQVVPGRLYLYAVTAVYPNNAESERAFANADITGQPVPVGIGVPLPPRNLQAQPGDSLVRLTWEDPNPSGIVRGYRVYRGTNAPPTDANLIADETTVRTTTFTDRGLSNGTTYFYVVRAVSTQNFLSVPSAVVPATPGNLPPQAPTLSGQFNPNAKTVTLTWTPSPDPDIAYYEVARIVKDISRSRALTTRVTRQTPIINLSPGVARRILQTNPRLRQTASEFDAHVIASNITATSFVENVAQFSPSGTAPTIYKELHYAVRAVDQSGQKSPWSNVVVITPNSPPPSLATRRPKVIPGNGQVTIDLLPLLTAANQDPQFGSEWQVDKKGVRIFRTTTKGGTSAAALPPINSPDPLPLENLQNGRFFVDDKVTNGTRYFYAVELVDKLGVAGGRSLEAVATPFATATITITSLRRELSGNGEDSVQLTITALDAASRPVAGLPLKVTLQGVGTLTVNPQYDDPYSDDPSDAITDDSGQTIATYRAAVISADTTVTITAASTIVTGVSPAQLTLTLRAPVVASVEIQPQQTQLVADGQSFTRVTITVRDRLGSPMPNQTVALSVSPAQGRFEDLSGNPITQVSTGTTGIVEVIYRSGTRAGSVTLTASVGAISGQAVITLIPGSPATIELVANPSVAKADGQTEVSVTATVRDANNNAVPNVQVQFSAVPALNILQPTVTTDSSGQATTTIIAPTQAGTYTLIARVGTISRSIILQFTAAEVSTIALSAERTQLVVTLPARYGETDYSEISVFSRTTITAAVRDGNNNPVGNVVVQFSANFGLIQATATTDDQGIARVVYVAPSVVPSGPVTVTATSGTATANLELTVIPGPPAKVRMSATPLVIPADGRTSSQLRIEVRDANDNIVADGTRVVLTLNPNLGSVQSPVATVNGVATSSYIPPTQTSYITVTAVAEGIVMGRTFRTDPNDPNSIARVQIFVGGQVQIVRNAPNFRTSVSVSSSSSTDPTQRNSLRTRPPVENTSDITVQIVDGQGNPLPMGGVQVRIKSENDPQVLFAELQGGQLTGNTSLQQILVLTNEQGQAAVRYYASPTAGTVRVTAELLDSQGTAFSSETVTITQHPGDPAIVNIPTPTPNLIFVPGAGTPTQTRIVAQVLDAVNNPVESGISVRFEANLLGRSVGVFTPAVALTDSNGQASSTLSSTPDTGVVTVTATASVPGQQTPATGSTTVSFVTGVTQISVTARDPRIGGADNDDIPDSTLVTANFVGAIPDGTRVTFTTTRGTFDPQSPVLVRQKVAAVTNNTAQVTLYKETVTAPVIATVQVSVLNAQGQPVTGSVDVTIVPVPGPIELQLEVAQSTLVVSDTNSPVPAQRQPLDPTKPNSTAVTVSVIEQGTNSPVPNTSVTLSSTDSNSLWVVGTTARLGQIVAQTDENGRVQATFYASPKAGEVTITATIDLGGGNTLTKQATITQEPGPPVLTVTTDKPEIFVRLPDNFNGFDYSQLPRSAEVTAKVADANGNPHKDIVVNFAASEGIITAAATTDANGEAKVNYSPPDLVPANGQVTITAQITVNGNQITGQTTLRVRPGPPAQISIAANPPELSPDGRSTSVVTATVKDANGNNVKDGTKVTFELQQPIPQGTTWLPNRQNTIEVSTVNGQAQATLLAGTQAGTANIKVSAEEIINGQNYKPEGTLVLPIGVVLQPIQVSLANLFVSKVENNQYTRFDDNYPNEAEVTVTVNPAISGVKVVLSASDSGSRWKVNGNLQNSNTVELTTGDDGEATATYVASTKAGQVTIEARMGNQVLTATINQQPGPPQVTVTANPERVFVRLAGAQYGVLPQQSQITVKVADENGNPHPNAAVQLTLETQTGPTGSLTAAMGRTDSQGQFVTTYQSPSQVPSLRNNGTGSVKVKASATTARNENATGELDLTILPGPPALVSLSADKLFVPANQTANLTAQVVDENGNKVRDGVVVAFRQISGPTDVSITPVNDGRVSNGQAKATLTAGTTSGAVVVEAKAEQVENGNRFEAVAQITVNVATTQPPVIVESLQVSPASVVVSNSNAVDPSQRQPLDPARPNKATATVVVLDENNNRPVAGILVAFRVEGSGNALLVSGSNRAMGQLTVTTDQNGRAQVEIYSPMEAGQVTVKASVDSNFPDNPEKTKNASLTFEPGLPLLQLAVNPDEVTVRLSNEEATVTVSIKDANGNGFANQTVQLQVDVGLLQRQVTGTSLTVQTGGNGEVQVTYIPPLTVPANGQATITAQGTVNGRNLSASVVVRVRPGPPHEIQVVANPSSLPNDGRSEAVITANVRDANGNAVRDGTAVTFTLSDNSKAKWLPTLGTSITVGTVNGQAQARLRAGTEAEAPVITVEADSKSVEIVLPIGVVLQPIQVSLANLFVSKVENNQYTRFGDNYPNEAEVTVEVKDVSGNPVKGVKVVLSASDSKVKWQKPNEQPKEGSIDVETDANGQAKVTYIASPRAGNVVITATLGNQVQTATINQQPGPPQVTVSANPESVFVRLAGAQYGVLPQQSQITVKVADENGNPHPNAAVLLTTTGGTLAASSGQTDSQGQFTTTLTAPTQVPAGGKVTVTAIVTTTRGERADSEPAEVTVQPGPPAIVELSATKLTLSETDSATITATVKDANGNPVPSGSGRTVSVTFTLQVSQANSGKVTLNPTSGTTNNNGQVLTTLTTNNAVADTARVTAEVREGLQATLFRASSSLNLSVGVTPVFLTPPEILDATTLVVSSNNSTDPNNRQPLDPNMHNRTRVRIRVSNTGGQPLPVTFISSDDNSLWQDATSAALKSLTTTLNAQGEAVVWFYASSKKGSVQIKVQMNGQETPSATIQQVAGLPASIVLTSDKTVVPQGSGATITATVTDNAAPQPNRVRQGTRVSFRLISAPSGVELETPTERSTPDENGQVTIRLVVNGSAANGVATIEARTDNNITQTLSLPVGVSPTLKPLQVTHTALSVSADNNPIARNPVNGATLPNQTTVKVVAENTGGLPVQVTLSSNDANTLWIDGATRSLQQITVTLDANGEKTVTFVASSTAREVRITASLNGQTQTATITQQPGPPAQITLSSDRDVIPTGGSAQLTALVVDAAAPTPNPVPNATVNFSFVVQPAGTTLNPTSANTNAAGEAITTLRAPATGSGQAVVRAQVTSPLNPAPAQVTVFVGLNPTLQSISVATPVLSVSANDNTTNPADRVNLGPEPSSTQITVQAANTGGQPIPVVFKAKDSKVLWDDGTNRALGELRTNLDANGRATVTYYASSKAGNVEVTVELKSPTAPSLTTSITQRPGNPATIQLSADKQIVPPSDQATITATVKDAAGNNVRDGTQVTFRLLDGAPPDTSLLPPSPANVLTQNGQAQVRLLAGTTSGQATVQATSDAVNANITLFVGVSPTLAPLRVENPNLVVSNSNSTDPTQRRPLDPNAQNNTVVIVQVRGTGGQPVPIILRSSDDNTLWVNRRDTSQRALKEITLTADANGVAEAIFYASTSARTVTITAVSGNETAQTVIVQKPGPPAQISLALQGFNRAPDGVPYLNIGATGTVIAAVVDANGNPIPNVTVNFSLSPSEGTLNPTSGTTGSDGQVQTSLTASSFSTEVTLRAQTGSVTATQTIRYSVSIPGLTITANPAQIPDDGTTTSTITIVSSDVNRPLPNNLKFRLSADLGATLSAGTEGTDQPSLILTVGNGQPTGEGSNQAQATLKGPNPDLSQTQPRTITLTANLIVDGMPRTFTQTVTLNPRIQITSDFGLSNNPNRLVVSSSNDTDQTRRVPLDTVAGHNKATIIVTLNGSATPNPSFVTFTSNDPNILFVEVDPSNDQEKPDKALGNLSVNFVPTRQDPNDPNSPIVGWKAVVNLYASTTASSNLVVQIGVLGVTRSIIFEQVPGLPAIVTVSPDRSVIGVTGHPTLPTSTAVRAIIRDAAGNLVTQPGVTVTFTADAGTLNPTSAPAVNGVATTTLTSNNQTRQVRVIARATAGNAEAVGAATIVFAVGGVSNITLTTDKPQDAQGRVLLNPNDLVRITATFSRTGSVPDGTIPIVTLTGAYGIIQSITPAQSDRSDVIVLNNNTTNVDQEVRIRFTVYNEQGLPVSSPEQIVIMKGVTVTPVISLTADRTILKVSTSNDTNENNRNALNPGGPSEPTGTTANRTTLTVTLNITGLNRLRRSHPHSFLHRLERLVHFSKQTTTERTGLGQIDIDISGTADGSGNLNTTVQRAYWASTKAGNFVITAEVKRQNGTVIGRASLNITQNPGNPAQVFLTTDPPRLAVSTVTTEPTAARVIATLFDANNNPVPNWWTFFQLQPVPVNMNPDFTDGESIGIPSVSDGVLDPFAVRTDSGGVAVSLIRSINTCQPVSIRAIADANNNGNLESGDADPDINRVYNSYDTVYYVPLTNASAVVDYNSVTRDIIVTVTPATALPPNTAIWVCRYAVANYAVDNDGDGRFDEDPQA
jgi:adhesin/invasin